MKRIRRIVEVYLPSLNCCGDIRRNRIHVHLQAKLKGLLWTYSWAAAAKFFALNGLMQLKLATPEILIAESIEAENALTFHGKLSSLGFWPFANRTVARFGDDAAYAKGQN